MVVSSFKFQPHCGDVERPNCGEWDCGGWEGHFWKPIHCSYLNISVSEARKCLENRTIGIHGDSQGRDIAYGLVGLLFDGETLENSGDEKRPPTMQNSHYLSTFKFGHLFPNKASAISHNISFQIQIFHQNLPLFNSRLLMTANGRQQFQTSSQPETAFRQLDIFLFHYGIHQAWEKYHVEPHGTHYYEDLVVPWTKTVKDSPFPCVFMGMNNECLWKMQNRTEVWKDKRALQFRMVNDANKVTNARAKADRIPYWDTGAPLRTNTTCVQSADGVHVSRYVDIMRAMMLLNHLCERDPTPEGGSGGWRWRTDIRSAFL